jgi:hypothetical protein
MNETKHTPGPWILGACAGQVEGPKRELLAGGIDYRIPEDVKLANARLIAAAPDLLKALKALLNLLEEHQDEARWYLKGHYNKANAAIAKAENEPRKS